MPGPVGMESKKELWVGPWFTDYGAGPFNTIAEMEAWFNRKLEICQDLRQCAESVPPFRFRRLVLTHDDIAPRNLILRPDRKVWLIDWGDFGIYPVGMDAATLSLIRRRAPDFTDLLLEKIQRHEVFSRQLQSIMYGLTTGAMIDRFDD
ncbi:uncharacterized protein BDV17DRAFT_291007 [Aspergillus undulatus]|uniref:uncharacterized protein n=1 Tax=Aspergillus undulatus TaxID=1810928 RepID=UPI003CCCF3FA